ncbi:hypothetical protein [Methylomonas albis]|uniref:Uncharacterized protein n=1 Tax=Methylomonas albis TaxID=1854563 RepID=A0ABR9D1G2_9GAMM|nr:hypothetical protein [Methylomonas albis]MBD9356960.1 hypothetical protein [Methylomonas albis]CAD6880150.1 hypothetical protein [Methylomonas albis]
MKFCKPAFLLYQLYHQEKHAVFQYVKWYSNYLSIYTISIPTKPKSTGKKLGIRHGVVTVPPILATVPHLKATPDVGLRGGGTVGTAKIAFFLFIYFGGIFRRSFPFFATAHRAEEVTH